MKPTLTAADASGVRRAADKMAQVAIDWVDRQLVGSRSALADALIEYAEIRCNDYSGNAVAKLREMLKAPSLTAADEPIVEKRQVCIICNRPCPIRVCGMCVDAIESPT